MTITDNALRRVLQYCGQRDKIAVFGSSRGTAALLRGDASLWEHLVIYNPACRGALAFCTSAGRKCTTLRILSGNPWNIASFLLDAVNSMRCVTSVHVKTISEPPQDVPSNFLSLCLGFVGLRHLTVHIDNQQMQVNCLNIAASSPGLKTLRSLRCLEQCGDDGHSIIVSFDGCQGQMPLLESIRLEVYDTDFLEDASRAVLPNLSRVRVRGETESITKRSNLKAQELSLLELNILGSAYRVSRAVASVQRVVFHPRHGHLISFPKGTRRAIIVLEGVSDEEVFINARRASASLQRCDIHGSQTSRWTVRCHGLPRDLAERHIFRLFGAGKLIF